MSGLHRLYTRQLDRATDQFGQVDLSLLGHLISLTYEDNDRDRQRVDRANALMGDELTALVEKREALIEQTRVQADRISAAFENMGHALVMVDVHGNLLLCNESFSELFQVEQDSAVGRHFDELIRACASFTDGRDGQLHRQRDEYLNLSSHSKPVAVEQVWHDGRVIFISHRPLASGGFIDTFKDVTDIRMAGAKIAHMALHDALTDLPNRRHLLEKLDDCLSSDVRRDCSLFYLDLDRFKWVNDTLGHGVGDALLVEVALRLQRHSRPGDLAARCGGDEFAILLRGKTGREALSRLAQQLICELSKPYLIFGNEICVGASIGIACAPRDATILGNLMKCADLALYSAKAAGKGQHQFFSEELQHAMDERVALERDLRNAIRRHEFCLFYQPFVDVKARSINGFEALIRWRSPTRGLVPPDSFIPIAEELGLIVPIGAWVLKQACMDAAKWPNDMRVAVNLSTVQFNLGNVIESVEEALAASGLPPHRLELEVTESLLLENSSAVLDTLHHLRALGISISMDDFGTGYSSLSYLTLFPFDRIKIDRSFTADIDRRPAALAVIRAVTGLCSSLGMASIAEGVETDAQLHMLIDERCEEVQGYLFDIPRPIAECSFEFPQVEIS